ncbi:MAG: methyltransferase domain-containing protein [Bdellovibrionales bacterium]|nr:methyltransferase domain-containing protein [Bdellovibrionales bacterium]
MQVVTEQKHSKDPYANQMARSILSPDFQYATSKNIYWDKLKNLPSGLKGLALTDHDTETHRGTWLSRFLSPPPDNRADAPLHVEIGCNAGHVTLEWAKQNPSSRYIGIDYKFKMIYKFAEKAAKFDVRNLIAFRANADRLPYMFAPGEIDFLYMFFPDPWEKKAQRKNRTADTEWLRSVAPLLRKGDATRGIFHIKTDHRDYFDFIVANLEELKDVYEILDLSYDLHAKHPNPKSLVIPEVTLFERLFIKDGLPIHSVKIRPKV